VSINHVVLTGNLTHAPELRATPAGMSVLDFGLAVDDRVKDPKTGDWTDRPNYFDVAVFGRRADALADILTRGMKVAVAGRLRWHEWQTDHGEKRSRVTVVADDVELMQRSAPAENAPAAAQPQGDLDDDIPF
jgi:single-strand DNA-binding protein